MIRARKRFGQHFLEPAWVDKLIRVIDPQPSQTFIEIGPGHGALTRPLAAAAKRVIAYEIDRDLVAELRAQATPNLTIVEGDFLDASVSSLSTPVSRSPAPRSDGAPAPTRRPDAVRIAGNLPYNVASPILFKLADLYAGGEPISDATVMLQREVAERLVASPGTGEYGVLSVLLQHVADTAVLLKLPPGAFRPPPKVHSAVVRLRFHAPDPPVADALVFAELVQAVFTRRRKTLVNALRAYREGGPELFSGSDPNWQAGLLTRALIDGRRRPETLTVAEFARLADVYATKR
jgi:16S rRNA (adenine1518-N6/adenine1519-N6)-dimethyltransferase